MLIQDQCAAGRQGATETAPKSPVAFPALNGMRGISALAVALFHAHPLTGTQLVPGGYLAVDLFFVMSGAVIAHAYDTRLLGGMSVGRFTTLRLIRFLPFYMAGLAVGVTLSLLLLANGSPSASAGRDLLMMLLFGALFLPLPVSLGGPQSGGAMFPLNAPAWSLFHELIVNISYAVLLPYLSDRRLIAIAAGSLVLTAAAIWHHGAADFGPKTSELPEAFCRTAFSFSCGVLVYRFRIPWKIPALIVMMFVCLLFLAPVEGGARWIFDLAVIALAFPLATALLISAPDSGSDETFKWLGDMSYGLYAIHYPIIWIMRGANEHMNLPGIPFAIGLIALLAVSCVWVERRVDRPFRQRITIRTRQAKP